MTVSTIGSTTTPAAPLVPASATSTAGTAHAAAPSSGTPAASFGSTLVQQIGQQDRIAAARDVLAAVPPPVALSWRGAADTGAPDAGIDALFRALKDGSFKPEPVYTTGNGIIATTLRATKVFDTADQFWGAVRETIGVPVAQLELAVRTAEGAITPPAPPAPTTSAGATTSTAPATVTSPSSSTGSSTPSAAATPAAPATVATAAPPAATTPPASPTTAAAATPAPASSTTPAATTPATVPFISDEEQAYRVLGGALPPEQIGWWRTALDYLLAMASRNSQPANTPPQ